ncbi:MAG: AAA family ATPase [Ardenticatenaceae bacterium]|nr:AAA family ATPase [Ardenticatenaceae bacterium]
MDQTIENLQAKKDLEKLLAILPERVCASIEARGRESELLEVVLDYGRFPTARYIDGEVTLSEQDVTREEIDQVVNSIGAFDDDNRAGIARTLHRISGIRNRRGDVVGLTCRVGRAVYGTIDIIADIVEQGHSILLLGRPGVGKTTMLREMARVLAEKKRVVIVDTSNEIGGDGDIPHRAVGKARRMQVPRPAHQHETMIEAVENHNPEVIVIDEIGRMQEAAAARTINERGVQLIGTAHGQTLENLLLNPTLSDLIGGIESVTLSDEEARRRGTQKTVLERRAPPTFEVLIEIQDRQQLLVHNDVTNSVDSMLRGERLDLELRFRGEEGEVQRQMQPMVIASSAVTGRRGGRTGRDTGAVPPATGGTLRPPRGYRDSQEAMVNGDGFEEEDEGENGRFPETIPNRLALTNDEPERKTIRVLAYGVARNRLFQAAKQLKIKLLVVDELADADVLVTLKSYYRRRRKLISDAENRRTPVYVLRANTVTQMERFLAQAMNMEVSPTDPFEQAIADAERAIAQIGTGIPSVDLNPAGAAIRRYQHQMARQANLVSHSYGNEPNRRVRIFSTRRYQ